MQLAFLLRPDGIDIDPLIRKLEGESRDLPILEAIRRYATPFDQHFNPETRRIDTYHRGETVSRVLEGITGAEPCPTDWPVSKCVEMAEMTARRRKRKSAKSEGASHA